MGDSSLNAQTRQEALDAMAASAVADAEPFDVLVIGGGVTGAGIALDAATRGLSVALVEGRDWSSGTSSRSSKLIHGGLRYLPMLDFGLVREALAERDLLLSTVAPHLVRPVPFILPLHHRVWERAYIGAGLMLYDGLATLAPGRRALPWHRHLTRAGIRRLFPGLRREAAVGAVKYWDARVDDARLVLALVRTAARHGARVAARTQVVELTADAPGGAVTGAELVDLESGRRLGVRARHTINATGVWTERTDELTGSEGALKVLASKGVHIVVPRDRIDGDAALTVPTEKSVLFVIPWEHHWLIGTTDTPWRGDLAHPAVTSTDVDYVLEHANAVLARPLARADVVATWAGLRPLLQPPSRADSSPVKLSREHSVAQTRPGLTTIAGGKLTTYRLMARDAVDAALGEAASASPSVTRRLPLLGAEGLAQLRSRADAIAAEFGWETARVAELIGRYGSALEDLLAAIREAPELASPLTAAPEYLGAEVVYALTDEGALHAEDVLFHRLRLGYEDAARAGAAVDEVLTLAARHGGWSASRCEEERRLVLARLRAEAEAARQPTDAAAEAVRLAAPEAAPWVASPG